MAADDSTGSLAILRALRRVARKEFEKKIRLGQYAVVWQDGKPVRLGPDELRKMLEELDAADHA